MDIDEHEHFMREALLEGERALIRAEVPVGCVFVHKGEIIASASNRVNELCNATMHAEIVAIEAIAAKYGDKACEVLADCTLYVTCEPCIMCAGALAHVSIKRVYFGCHNDRFGGCSSVLNLHERSAFPKSNTHRGFPCVSGILKDEAITLLKKFYTSENPRVEDSKKKRKKRSPEIEEPSVSEANGVPAPV
ncbi:Cytidine and deoxycytidylate deaminase zinc-binding region [Phytophthora infestans]|uniref:Cytidine and deoxycytidylate deaminase zinc-binding region n=1 Tax=Phytophthora infestans TaxID=4787 RepID=A0A833T4C0_PHYIN|nr:Cytidine and deoxycytidylate deaminase zinc-binding region [Phytophthora infestans]